MKLVSKDGLNFYLIKIPKTQSKNPHKIAKTMHGSLANIRIYKRISDHCENITYEEFIEGLSDDANASI